MSQELEKYYLRVIQIILKLRLEKKHYEAIDVIKQELQAPYIPIEFDGKLNELLADVTFEMNETNQGNKFLKFTREELFEKITNYSEGSIYATIVFFERFKSEYKESEIKVLKNILNLKNINNDLKIIILEQLKLNCFKGKCNFYSKMSQKNYEIDIQKQKFVNEEPLFIETFSRTSNLYYDEPMTNDLANNIIFAVYNHYFPDFSPIKSEKELVIGLVQALGVILGSKKSKETTRLCHKILEIMDNEKGRFNESN